jgi:hypothetical protein
MCMPSIIRCFQRDICNRLIIICRSQWPRDLRHEMFWSWIRIRLKAWISVSIYSVFVLGSGPVTGCSPVQGVLPSVRNSDFLAKIWFILYCRYMEECNMVQVEVATAVPDTNIYQMIQGEDRRGLRYRW